MEDKMKFTKLAAVFAAGVMLLTSCGNGNTGELSADTAIRVGDVNVSAGLFKAGYGNYRYAAESMEAAKEQLIEQSISRYEIIALAHAMGVELDDETKQEVEDYKKQFKDYYETMDGGFEGFLKDNEVTEADFDLDISVAYYANAIMDGKMREYFDANYRRAKHVLIKADDTNDAEAKAKAEDILSQARNGADFDKLIADNGEDPGMTSNPDGYYFTDNEMVKEFQDGVDSIQPGEFTLVKTSYGYHVIERLDLFENKEAYENGYKQAQYNISMAMGDEFDRIIEDWVKEYGIEAVKNDEVIDKAVAEAEEAYQAQLAENEAQAEVPENADETKAAE